MTSGIMDHCILNSDVKREEMVEFGPLDVQDRR
jgi:hypothetical protein